MKNIKLSVIALVAIGNMVYAGGDISPVTYYETNDAMEASVAYEEMVVEPIYEAPINEPVYIEPKPIVEVVPEPKPVPVEPEPVVVKPVPIPVPVPVPVTAPKHIAPSGFYAGLGITGSRYQSSCDCPTDKSSLSSKKTQRSGKENNVAMLARVGYDFNRYVGLEVRGMKTIGSTSNADIEHIGLFVKPMAPITDALNAYALIGVAKTTVSGSYQNVDAESLALGAGVEYDLSKDTPKEGRYSRSFDGQGDQERGMGLFVDYERLVVKSNAPDLDTLSAGVTYDF